MEAGGRGGGGEGERFAGIERDVFETGGGRGEEGEVGDEGREPNRARRRKGGDRTI